MSENADKATSQEGRKRLISQELRDITGEEVVEFFRQVAPEACCPMCGTDLLVMAGVEYDEDGQRVGNRNGAAFVGVVIDEDPDRGYGLKTPAIPVSCDKCGYISYFLANRILRWKRKNEDSE